jgi:DNA excision repair protein ERCC-4
MTKNNHLTIVADYRESPSGIPDMLAMSQVQFISKALKSGDYLIDNQIIAERKTNEDFIQSIIQKRLFGQCSKLRHSGYLPIFIIEGNPYQTKHCISREAIRGALISISVSWQIPVLCTQNTRETCEILLNIGSQMKSQDFPVYRKGYKPKRLKNLQLFFLQGLPGIGSRLGLAMLKRFGSLQRIVNAPADELCKVPGIGSCKAESIREFLEKNFKTSQNG